MPKHCLTLPIISKIMRKKIIRKILRGLYRFEHAVYCITGTRVEMLLHRMYHIGLRRRYARLLGNGENTVRELLRSGSNDDIERADEIAQLLGLRIQNIDLFIQAV